MLDITSAKNGNVQHSFRFLVHGFQPHSSNIPLGHHSGSNPHSQAGHYRWDNSVLTSAPWSHPVHWGFHCCATAAFCFPKKTKNPNPSPIEKRFGFSILTAVFPVDIPTGPGTAHEQKPHWGFCCPACGRAVLFKSSYPHSRAFPKGRTQKKNDSLFWKLSFESADKRTWTSTELPRLEPESNASANSAISAYFVFVREPCRSER